MNKEKLKKAGIDVNDALQRFLGNEELFAKILKGFDGEGELQKLSACLKDKKYDEAFVIAHTLKGETGNLSMVDSYKKVCNLVEALRVKRYDNVDTLFEDFSTSFSSTLKGIKEALNDK
jgi:HPt (histidine-containing phosphotransfer) domain-containing protein